MGTEAPPKDPDAFQTIPGMHLLAGADLVVVFTRFMKLPDDELPLTGTVCAGFRTFFPSLLLFGFRLVSFSGLLLSASMLPRRCGWWYASRISARS